MLKGSSSTENPLKPVMKMILSISSYKIVNREGFISESGHFLQLWMPQPYSSSDWCFFWLIWNSKFSAKSQQNPLKSKKNEIIIGRIVSQFSSIQWIQNSCIYPEALSNRSQ
jgi:hypothetical protein